MARRRSRPVDRGGPELEGPNGTLPPGSGPEFELERGMPRAGVAVYRDGTGAGRTPRLSIRRPPFLSAKPTRAIGRLPSRRVADIRRRLFGHESGLRSFPLPVAPYQVKFCVARKQRREILFAKKKAGFSGSAPKRRYRRTLNSKYRC